jgi:hypothetical protein
MDITGDVHYLQAVAADMHRRPALLYAPALALAAVPQMLFAADNPADNISPVRYPGRVQREALAVAISE